MQNVVAAVLVKNDKILLPKRSANLSKFPNYYEFPGGKVENGESLEEALKRELYEELVIDVNIKDIEQFPNNVLIKTDLNIILTIFIVKKWKNELTLNSSINSNILEVNFNELKNVKDLLETDKEVIPYILEFLTS